MDEDEQRRHERPTVQEQQLEPSTSAANVGEMKVTSMSTMPVSNPNIAHFGQFLTQMFQLLYNSVNCLPNVVSNVATNVTRSAGAHGDTNVARLAAISALSVFNVIPPVSSDTDVHLFSTPAASGTDVNVASAWAGNDLSATASVSHNAEFPCLDRRVGVSEACMKEAMIVFSYLLPILLAVICVLIY